MLTNILFVCNLVNSVFFPAQDGIFSVSYVCMRAKANNSRAYESYSLEPRPTRPWPAIARKTSCRFLRNTQLIVSTKTLRPPIELLRLCYLATGAFETHWDIGSPRAFFETAASDKTSVLWQTSPLSAFQLFRFLWIFFFIIPQFPFLGGGPLGGCVCGLKYSRHQGSDQLQNLLKQGGRPWWKERRQRSLFQCVQQSPKNPERFLIFARTQW